MINKILWQEKLCYFPELFSPFVSHKTITVVLQSTAVGVLHSKSYFLFYQFCLVLLPLPSIIPKDWPLKIHFVFLSHRAAL